MASFGRNGRFMAPALRLFGREKLLAYLYRQKVPVTVVDDLYYFPATLKASDIRDAFLLPAQKKGLILKTGSRLRHLILEDDQISGVELSDGTRLFCQKLILATGGCAMPQLGAVNDGLLLAAEAGHKIVPPLPAMAPLCLKETWVKESSGISLPDAELFLICGSTFLKTRGSLLFTHEGLSGMAALNLSDTAYRMFQKKPEKVKISLNFCAGKTLSDYLELLHSFKKDFPEKQLKTSLGTLLPRALAARICTQNNWDTLLNRELKNNHFETLPRLLAAMPLSLEKIPPMEKAMAMSGGVHLKEVDPKNLASRLVSGLHFAGEILDLTGPCGGFNIQFALSSGYLAGSSMSDFSAPCGIIA